MKKRWYTGQYCAVMQTHVEKDDGCEIFSQIQELVELKEEQCRCINCRYFGGKKKNVPPFMREAIR